MKLNEPSKHGRLSDTTLESTLGHFLPTDNVHRRWKGELTDQSTVVENIFLPGLQSQKQYKIQQTRSAKLYFSINVNECSNQPTNHTVGYPIATKWFTTPIRAFFKPTLQQPVYNLR
jgi:hypothetical protein